MLPRKNLIPLKSEWLRIQRTGRSIDTESFRLIVNLGGEGEARAAFIVSRKVDLRSVVRHQVKRRLAEAVRKVLPGLEVGAEAVFLAKRKASQVTEETLEEEVKESLRRAGALKE